MCLATAEIKIRGFDFHFSFYPSGLEDSLSITDKLNMMHTHMHVQMALCTQKKMGPFAFRSAFMRYAFSNYVYSWGLGDDFRNGIQRIQYSTGSRINDCRSLILILKVGGIPFFFFFLASIWHQRDWIVLFPFLPLLHALSSHLASFHIFKVLGKMVQKRTERRTGTHPSEPSFCLCGVFSPMLELAEERNWSAFSCGLYPNLHLWVSFHPCFLPWSPQLGQSESNLQHIHMVFGDTSPRVTHKKYQCQFICLQAHLPERTAAPKPHGCLLVLLSLHGAVVSS